VTDTPPPAMTPDDIRRLRALCDEPGSLSVYGALAAAVPRLLDALEAADARVEAMRERCAAECAPPPARGEMPVIGSRWVHRFLPGLGTIVEVGEATVKLRLVGAAKNDGIYAVPTRDWPGDNWRPTPPPARVEMPAVGSRWVHPRVGEAEVLHIWQNGVVEMIAEGPESYWHPHVTQWPGEWRQVPSQREGDGR
jgi:hypothetical protein